MILIFLAPLTEGEVAAIDAAGTNGPPVTLLSVKERLFKLPWRKWLFSVYHALLVLFLLVGYHCWLDGMQRFAA